jgi:RNA polymerase sigma factor (sigma-70 family)
MPDGVAMESRVDGRRELDERLVAELPALRAFLRRVAGSSALRGELEDIAQEAVARALKYSATFEVERALTPWLRGTALRALLDHRRRRSRAPQELDDNGAQVVQRVDADASRSEQREEIERALVKLSSVEREIIVRFHARGESLREIAAALRMPEGTVKSHLHRARRKLGAGGKS